MRGRTGKIYILGIFLCAWGRLCAAPLEGGYALAPAANASAEQKGAAFQEARFMVIAAASKYEKTPYRYGGVDARGMDCSGLVFTSFKDALSVSVPRTAAGIYSWSEKIADDRLMPGDLVFFKTDRSGTITHVGIYVGGGRFIHSASEGPQTGVMYTGLNESYWARTYAGAGRALPAADINAPQNAGSSVHAGAGANAASKKSGKSESGDDAAANEGEKKGYALVGIAAAPSWNGFLKDGKLIRGVASQLRAGVATSVFGVPLVFGIELRPEWDYALDIFRLPITFSLGYKDKISIFAGPAFSFGDAILKTSGGERRYASGSPWFGAAGINLAPFALKISKGALAPYAEFAWQSYFSDNNSADSNADICVGFRLSTGLRFTWNFR